MNTAQYHISQERLNNICNIAKGYVTDNTDLLTQFIPIYYTNLYKETAKKYTDEDLAGMALHHYMMLKNYQINQPDITAFNPMAEEHHFHNSHSIIQLVAYDRPFLVDTMLMTLEREGINVHRFYNTIINIERDDNDTVSTIKNVKNSDKSHISLIHFEIDRHDSTKLKKIQQMLSDKVSKLDIITQDWAEMRQRLESIKTELSTKTLVDGNYPAEEIQDFLSWMLDEHFIFLGFREYRLETTPEELNLTSIGGTGLGVLRGSEEDTPSKSFNQLPKNLKNLLTNPRVLLLSKSSHVSPVHRPVYMDFLGIHKLDDNGKVVGEYRFVGLLTSHAYQLSAQQIPLLREKAQNLLSMSDLPTDGHGYHKMIHIIDTLPRDDLFQAPTEELFPIVSGVSQLQDKKRLKLFARVDHYQRFISCLVYIPNNKFNTELRIKVRKHLQEAYNGVSSEFSVQFSESYHARLHVHVRTNAQDIKINDVKKLELELTNLMENWSDDFATDLHADIGELQANSLLSHYAKTIPASYKEDFDTRTAVEDIKRLHDLSTDNPMIWHLYQSTGDGSDQLHLKIYGKNSPANLSSVLPVLENFGVVVETAQNYEFSQKKHSDDSHALWMQEYSLNLKHSQNIDINLVRSQFGNALKAIWNNEIESDRLNELILTSSLATFDVVMLRALSKYMLQAKAPFSIDYIQQTLVNNKNITLRLVELFHARMVPINQDHIDGITFDKIVNETERQTKVAEIKTHIANQLQSVSSLDEDRIIKWMLDLLNAMLRTNFYQVDDSVESKGKGKRKNRLSFKFKASDIPNLPQPKPMFEIYVYSPQVEAVHLRGGKVARGGLRWSDRMEDYRTEVLGLVKAQMVKNSVIVPVGSKGGFIVKKDRTGMNRDEWFNEGIACYKTFIRGMLDITDNLVNGKVVSPLNTTRHDEDDPYLVVAADKGTATFSDIANGLSREYSFWLDDAFASGGSVGYDHKLMGITAKGAWESVKRHFRLEGKDIQTKDEFTVVGIGDMGGDVFGNGMLLSRHIKLQAAFNHLHIFIDPNPTAENSYIERERMFNLPRSTWEDYSSELISKGGGVFSRSEKSIAITDEMKQAFDIDVDSLTPDDLIHALLKAPVDLIWNGGIGTYVKAESESHADVGDKANDSLRVNGKHIRAKIIGEGGNLGCTQRGRIEYAQNGGRIYTDAIDNSGGVNCSDHEVNIKILLGDVVAQGDMTTKQRNELLESMTDAVSELVLRQNYLQPQTIELSSYEAKERLNEHQHMMQVLEGEGRLNREIELLPSDEEISVRQKEGKGLTNPEFSVLLAYCKMWVFDSMLASDLPDEKYFQNELRKYFPDALDSQYFDQMTKHRLHREIISTYLTNSLVNRLGIETVFRLVEETGKDIATITRAYAVTRDIFDIYQPWKVLEEIDNQVDATLQIELELRIRQSLKHGIAWVINTNSANISNTENISIDDMTNRYKDSVQSLMKNESMLQQYFAETLAQADERFSNKGLTAAQLKVFAILPIYSYALDVVQLSIDSKATLDDSALVYFSMMDALNMGWVKQQLLKLPQKSYWDRRANNALTHEFNKTARLLTSSVLQENDAKTTLTNWLNNQQVALDGLTSAKNSMENESAKLSALSVLLSEMNGLV